MLTYKELQQKPFSMVGPCVIDSGELLEIVAVEFVRLRDKFQVPIIFKSSFDKANRTSVFV